MLLWWFADALLLAAVLLAALLAHRVIVQALAIRRYAEDILVHGVGLTGALDPLPALEDTRRLAGSAASAAAAYVQALQPRSPR